MIVADLDFGIGEYYRWWVEKRFGLMLQPTAWMPHVTVLDGKSKLSDDAMKLWKKQQKGKKRLKETRRVTIPPEIFFKLHRREG